MALEDTCLLTSLCAMQTFIGSVTQIIPPNYGIVDDDTFYVDAVVTGRIPQVPEQPLCQQPSRPCACAALCCACCMSTLDPAAHAVRLEHAAICC